jgi:uncharacterized membrane protein
MNTTQLLYELQEVPFDSNLKLASLCITIMYTNVPKQNYDKLYMIPSSTVMSTLTLPTKFYQSVLQYCTKIIFIATYKNMASLWKHLHSAIYQNFTSSTWNITFLINILNRHNF